MVVVFWQPPLGPTFSFSQPEKLLIEHSSKAALARRRMEEMRIKMKEKSVRNESNAAGQPPIWVR